MEQKDNWISIAPIRGLHILPAELELPFHFDDRTCLENLPSWASDDTDTGIDQLLPRLRESVKGFHVEYCLSVRYEADALGTPDPDWKGADSRSKQDVAIDSLYLVCLSLWLARPTATGYHQVAHVAKENGDVLVRQYSEFDQFRALKQYSHRRYRHNHFIQARDLYSSISSLSRDGTVFSAIGLLGSALTQQTWHLRFLILWLILEALFGPDDAREITYRISQRIGMFLGKDKADARNVFKRVKKSYAWRSKIVHGLRLAKLTSKDSDVLIFRLEHTIRHCLLKILGDREKVRIFNSKGREEFLDDLIFT